MTSGGRMRNKRVVYMYQEKKKQDTNKQRTEEDAVARAVTDDWDAGPDV